MLYKALGFTVWKGGKLVLRRRLPGRKVAIMSAGGTLLAAGTAGAVLAAVRHRASS
jgi:hypothetical protein